MDISDAGKGMKETDYLKGVGQKFTGCLLGLIKLTPPDSPKSSAKNNDDSLRMFKTLRFSEVFEEI